MELSSLSQDCETARIGQRHLLAEVRDREQAHQETLTRMCPEVEELKKIRCSEAELREEAFMDAISQDDGNKLETESREIQSTVHELTHQTNEPQEEANLLSESQDFKYLETASCSGSAHAPGNDEFFRVFS